MVRQALPGPCCWLEGNTSVFGLYCQLWHHRHQPVVLDDLDGLYASRDGVRLLKCLTQSEPVKRVSWHTDAATLQREQIPQEFSTTSQKTPLSTAIFWSLPGTERAIPSFAAPLPGAADSRSADAWQREMLSTIALIPSRWPR